jgi:hypothetical protein
MAWFGALWIGAEVTLRVPYLRKMAIGWRFLSFLGVATGVKAAMSAYCSITYGPLICAFFRKYSDHVKEDPF